MAESILTNVAALSVGAAALLIAARLITVDPAAPSLMSFAIRVVAWSFVAAALAILLIILSGGGGVAPGIANLIVLTAISLVVLAMLYNRAALTRQDVLLAVLASSVRKGR